ncbi:MAG: radical SAM protein [Chloroflexi bacterium]|nr:radical SAM protein [Chloroflexota bacterium]
MKPQRAYTNLLRLRINLALKRQVINSYPVLAYIDPTSACHLRCPACPTGLRLGLRPPARLAWDVFEGVMDELGPYLFELHLYNWGEPLLYPETPDMIRTAKAHDITVRLSSNLSLSLDDATIEALVGSGLDTLVVSLDGATAETYQHYRRGGDFDRVRANMRHFRAARDAAGRQTPVLVCQFLVFQHNEHEIDTIRAVYQSWGADQLILAGAHMPFPPHDAGFAPSTQPEFDLYHPDHPYQRNARRLLRGRAAGSWLYGGVVLNPTGAISPCCGVAAEADDFGHVAGGFRAVWNGTRYRRARSLFQQSRRGKPAAGVPAEWLDGMGAGLPAGEGVICARCPIPFRQDDIHKTVARVAWGALVRAVRERRPRYLLALALMGGPNRAAWRWLLRWLRRQIAAAFTLAR